MCNTTLGTGQVSDYQIFTTGVCIILGTGILKSQKYYGDDTR